MPDLPEEAVAAAVDEIMRRRGLAGDHSRAWAEPIAVAALEGAAAFLGDHAAGKISAHMEAHGPKPGGLGRGAWRRHFDIAARVAARAFLTDEDMKRLAAEALNRGDFAACYLDDAGRSVTREREDGDRD